MREKIKELLTAVNADIDYEKEENLVEDGLLASYDLLNLIAALEEEFSLTISPADIEPENFNSLDALCAFVAERMA